MDAMQELLTRAKAAAPHLAMLSTKEKNNALLHMAKRLREGAEEILAANREDVAAAKEKLGSVMVDRLALSEARIEAMAKGIEDVVSLADPVGLIGEEIVRPNGLQITRVSVPLGVIAIIYESRPNVTSDAAALCLKSGNVCILRGGKDAFHTSYTIVNILRRALAECGLSEDFVSMPQDTSRESAARLMAAVDYVDALIPRGGAGLIRACVEQARVPCIQTGTGICHIYVDAEADPSMALSIVENAKTSRPSVCNAAEVCLVHAAVASEFLPRLKARLVDDRRAAGLVPVELRLDPRAAAIIDGMPAGEQDFDTEFLDYVLAVRVVDTVEDAIAHIAAHSTHHSEAIVTANGETAARFTRAVDSAAVYHNASTRFTDGGEFGLGCEIGISTQKLHARGPMGLRELTSYKYIVRGNGQVR
ncbi:MAG: glutamate-5-semialdehyde dehydrogenase [Clostridia bacterium]|nr:glutamate-5-semialdehyde dehydrogenase [Clostridia bacterium]